MKNMVSIIVLVLSAAVIFPACRGDGSSAPGTDSTYTITYDANGATGGSVPSDTAGYAQGQIVTVFGNTGDLVRAGYAFTGWNTQPDGSGTGYAVGETFAMETADMTLYAAWSEVPVYAVIYDGNGAESGSAPVDPNQYAAGQTVTVRLSNGIKRNDYTFDGWNTQADGNGITYKYGQTFAMGTADAPLYARWRMHGQKEVFTADNVTFKMIKVSAKKYPRGTYETAAPGAVAGDYWLGETEVTYELWSKVYIWASGDVNMNGTIDGGESPGSYTFANPGRQGGDNNNNRNPVGNSRHPVTTINTRDAIVWCNALTEWYNANNGTNYTRVYYSDAGLALPLRDSRDGIYGSTIDPTPGSFDNPYVKSDATGFRLPAAHSNHTSDEWELAARYIADSNGDGDIMDPGEYYPGVYASGAESSTGNSNPAAAEATGLVAVFTPAHTAEVKTKGPNSLGLYDMSGNVTELLFQPAGINMFAVGGSWWGGTPPWVMIGVLFTADPYSEKPDYGFRLARTAF